MGGKHVYMNVIFSKENELLKIHLYYDINDII